MTLTNVYLLALGVDTRTTYSIANVNYNSGSGGVKSNGTTNGSSNGTSSNGTTQSSNGTSNCKRLISLPWRAGINQGSFYEYTAGSNWRGWENTFSLSLLMLAFFGYKAQAL
jgi:hypothetical protein